LSSVANILDMASFLARTERKAEANPPEHDTTEHVSEHEAAERAAENDTTEQHEATEKAAEDGAGAFEQQASERSPEHETEDKAAEGWRGKAACPKFPAGDIKVAERDKPVSQDWRSVFVHFLRSLQPEG
jgi:hypothetical protein